MAVTTEDLKAFLQERPPRAIPANIRKRRLRGMLGVGGYIFGLLFGGFGSIFLVIFFPWRLADELALDLGTPAVAAGRIARVEKTRMSEGGGKHSSGTPIYRLHFQFVAPDGEKITGQCYRTGRGGRVGTNVQIEHLAASPAVSRIRGSRLNPFGYGAAFVALFPLVGFGVAFFAWRARARAARLLREGEFSLARVTEVRETNVKVNNRCRFRVTVSFNADREDRTATYNAYGEDVDLARTRMESAADVGVLYDPANLRRVLLVDSLLSG